MNQPTLSICIPAYKRPKDLEICISSLVKQKEFTQNWIELIICDDAPDKPISTTVLKFQKKYGKEKIKYFLNSKNLGFEKNILLCIEKAQNSYIYFLTDDDLFTADALLKIKELLTDYPNIDFFTSTYLTQHEDGSIFGDYKIYPESKFISKDPKDTAHFFGVCNDLSGKCFKKKLFSVSGYRRHLGSMYPHLYSFGKLILTRNTFYEVQPLFIQTIGNFTYWNYPVDHCIKGKFKIIEDLGEFNSDFVQLSKEKIISNCPYIMYLYLNNPKRLFAFLGYLRKYGILSEPRSWWYFIVGATQILKEKFLKPQIISA